MVRYGSVHLMGWLWSLLWSYTNPIKQGMLWSKLARSLHFFGTCVALHLYWIATELSPIAMGTLACFFHWHQCLWRISFRKKRSPNTSYPNYYPVAVWPSSFVWARSSALWFEAIQYIGYAWWPLRDHWLWLGQAAPWWACDNPWEFLLQYALPACGGISCWKRPGWPMPISKACPVEQTWT